MNRVYFALLLAVPFIVAPGPVDEKKKNTTIEKKVETRKQEQPEPPALTCHISADPTCKLGQVPNIKVKISNRTGGTVHLVGSLDGSDCQMRYPHAYFEVIGPNGQSAIKGIARCGNTNPLRVQDFVKVAANATFDPYTTGKGFFGPHQLRAENFDQPGKYRIRFVYSTQAPKPDDWRERPRSNQPLSDNIATLLKSVPKTKLVSNEIVVEVKK